MKPAVYSLVLIATIALFASCNNVSYEKSKSGLLYKIIPSNGKDSLIKEGAIVKFNYTIKFNDSLMERLNSYGKLPGYVKVQTPEKPSYDFLEILTQMRKGDSAVTVQMADTLMKMQSPILPTHAKRGDRITMTIKIAEVFQDDSTAQADYFKEAERDRPRQMKEQEEEMAKMQKQMNEERAKEELEMERSGEAAKGIREIEDYLKAKNITAQKTGKGTFVAIQEQGTGAQADSGKFVTVKYAGKFLDTDSLFQASSTTFRLGEGRVISGWDEGIKLFKEGGKGTLYIPGFRAYGKNPPQNSPFKPFQSLKFDVELLKVSDTPPEEMRQPQGRN